MQNSKTCVVQKVEHMKLNTVFIKKKLSLNECEKDVEDLGRRVSSNAVQLFSDSFRSPEVGSLLDPLT